MSGVVTVQVADLAPAHHERVRAREFGPTSTPGQEDTSAVICSLALFMQSGYKFK